MWYLKRNLVVCVDLSNMAGCCSDALMLDYSPLYGAINWLNR